MDSLLRRVEDERTRAKYSDLSDLPDALLHELRTQLAAAVERLAPKGSVYTEGILPATSTRNVGDGLLALVGVLTALRNDYAAGYLASIEELIHATVFADFLDMATELLDKGFKDAGAVITGSVLEEHLRVLAMLHAIPIDLGGKAVKADKLNADLEKAGVYNKLELKTVTAWLDLRNKAAHGKYDEYSATQVQQMRDGVRDFALRHPA